MLKFYVKIMCFSVILSMNLVKQVDDSPIKLQQYRIEAVYTF